MDATEHEAPTDVVVVMESGRLLYERLVRALWTEGIKVVRAGPAATQRAKSPLLVVSVDAVIDWPRTQVLCGDQPTLLIASAPSPDDVLRAIDIGARGYLPDSISDRALVDAIRGIRAGEVAFSRAALGAWLRNRSDDPSNAAASKLTRRQRQILALVARGASDKEIGGVLGISTATAQKHVTNLLRRLGAPNRAAAVAMMGGYVVRWERRAG
jgi:DNA-binding CsgD family transcriptional regulator